MESFNKSVALRPSDLGGAVLDAFKLEEQLVGIALSVKLFENYLRLKI